MFQNVHVKIDMYTMSLAIKHNRSTLVISLPIHYDIFQTPHNNTIRDTYRRVSSAGSCQ